MLRISIKGGELLIDEQDLELVESVSLSVDFCGYAAGSFDGKRDRLHRRIVGAKPGEIVDHRNRIKLDCRRTNLRIAEHSGNAANTKHPRANNSSGYRGVSLCKQTGRWRVEIRWKNKRRKLGRFVEAVEAARVYDAEALLLHGEYAVLNFPAAPQ